MKQSDILLKHDMYTVLYYPSRAIKHCNKLLAILRDNSMDHFDNKIENKFENNAQILERRQIRRNSE